MSDELTELQAMFIAFLKAADGRASNKSLQGWLSLPKAEYDSLRHQLVAKGLVRNGRGRGGTVILRESV